MYIIIQKIWGVYILFECNIDIKLVLPGCPLELRPGNRIRIGRFSLDVWSVGYGWYSWGGNRKVCGWYLTNCKDLTIKPLQDIDLCDAYFVET